MGKELVRRKMMITNMRQEHVAQVAALEKLCFSDPWSENSVASELNNPLSLWLVALDGETVAGYVGSQTVMDESDMMNLAVHPDYRCQGIGSRLVDELIKELKKKGSQRLTLEVRVSNEPAKRLYDELGFSEIAVRKRYYSHPKEDALILRKEW